MTYSETHIEEIEKTLTEQNFRERKIHEDLVDFSEDYLNGTTLYEEIEDEKIKFYVEKAKERIDHFLNFNTLYDYFDRNASENYDFDLFSNKDVEVREYILDVLEEKFEIEEDEINETAEKIMYVTHEDLRNVEFDLLQKLWDYLHAYEESMM